MSGEDAVLKRAEAIAKSLYPHQVEGVAFLLGRRRSLLADDMGLGKTRQSIVALTEAEPKGPYLVVCPASVKRNWVREIQMVLPDARAAMVGPPPLPGPGFDGWVILNYDILGKHLEGLLAFNWSGMVFDEAHFLKNHQSQRSRQAGRLVRQATHNPVVHALTGTPLTSRPRDLFPLLQLVDHALGRSFRTFAKRYCEGYDGEYGLVADGASHIEELAVQLHGVMLRRTKDEVLDLPPKVRTWLEVDVHPRAVEHLNNAMRELLTASRGPSEAVPGDPERLRRRGEAVGRLTTARRKLALVKLPQTLEHVQGAVDQGEKVIVFSAFLGPIQRMAKHFGDQAVVVTGEVAPEQRQERVDRFQTDDRVRVFIANLHVGGVGLNLTAARQVVFNDLDWVPASHWQAEDRAYRIGQTGAVNVTYMVGRGTMDEFVRTVLETKARLIDDLIEGQALADQTDVLGELKRMMTALNTQLDGIPQGDEQRMTEILREASAAYLSQQRLSEEARRRLVPYSEEAVRTLARVLAGPDRAAYRAESASKPGKSYRLDVVGADVTCDCPGFAYRGSCAHARALKDALVGGGPLPEGFAKVG